MKVGGGLLENCSQVALFIFKCIGAFNYNNFIGCYCVKFFLLIVKNGIGGLWF